MIAYIAAGLILAQGELKTITVEAAEGHSLFVAIKPGEPPPQVELDADGEVFRVFRQGKNVRVELGKELLLLCLNEEEYLAIDLKKKIGARYLAKSTKQPPEEGGGTNGYFARYTMWMFFPLWPDKFSFMYTGRDRVDFLKADIKESASLEAIEHPLYDDVVSVSNGDSMWIRRRNVDAAPCALSWHKFGSDGIRFMAYEGMLEKGFEKAEAPLTLFEVPRDVRLEEFSGFSDPKWTVFKDLNDFVKWRDPLTASDRKPKK